MSFTNSQLCAQNPPNHLFFIFTTKQYTAVLTY